jgi:3-keto-disaccharide hydrolase
MGRITSLSLLLVAPSVLVAQGSPEWRIHDMRRPTPASVAPVASPVPVAAPEGATVLFDGTSLSHWVGSDGKPARWRRRNGWFEVRPGSGDIMTVDSFGDMQLHLEWAAPLPAKGRGQDRGNSGVFLMSRYELQILDSYGSDTYADGQAGAMYGQSPPLFNASRPAGQWQVYDVFFRRPRFDSTGALLAPARVTVLHNGVPAQNNVELHGPTSWLTRLPYQAHPDRLPLKLQDHSFPVRFRNIWVRSLPEGDPPPPAPLLVALPDSVLAPLAGRYMIGGRSAAVSLAGSRLWLDLGDGRMPLVAESESRFSIDGVDAPVTFTRDRSGTAASFTMEVGGETWRYTREP